MKYKWTAVTVTTFGTVMGSLDQRIVVVGLPTVARQLQAGPEELVWITQSYVLATTVCLLLFGRIGDVYGRVKLYKAGFVVFTLGSGLCALSQNSYELIVFRIVQGVGAAMLFANSSAIITDSSPLKDLGTMLGINNATLRIGALAGLTLSGLILSVADWRGLFYVNIPIGIAGTLWAHLKLREISIKDPSKKMDWLGFGFLTVSLTLLLLGITFLNYGISGQMEGYSFALVGIAVLVIFVRMESKSNYPMLDLHLFKIRKFAAANVAQLLNAITWTGVILLLAFYLQVGLRFSPLQAGLGIIPMEATFLISSLISGRLSDVYDTRILTTNGIALQIVGYATLSTFGETTSYIQLAAVLSLIGVGNGFFNSPNTREIMSSVPGNRRGIASGFRSFVYNAGLTVSYGLMVSLITFGIPYDTLAKLLQNTLPQSGLAFATNQFLNGFRIAALVFAIIMTFALIPSIMRQRRGEIIITDAK